MFHPLCNIQFGDRTFPNHCSLVLISYTPLFKKILRFSSAFIKPFHLHLVYPCIRTKNNNNKILE